MKGGSLSPSAVADLRGPNEVTKIWFLGGQMARITSLHIFLSSDPSSRNDSVPSKPNIRLCHDSPWAGRSHTPPNHNGQRMQFLQLVKTQPVSVSQLCLKNMVSQGKLGYSSYKKQGKWMLGGKHKRKSSLPHEYAF